MIRILTAIVALACLLTSVTVSAENKQTEVKPFKIMPFKVPAPDILGADGSQYRSGWQRLSGFELSGLHWNQFVVVYANQGRKIYKNNYIAYLQSYMDEEDLEEEKLLDFEHYAPGTVFIKEGYLGKNGHPSVPLTLSIMIKHKPGYDTNHGDWEYLQTDVDGNILVRGKAEDPNIFELCGECHQHLKERDYIFSTFYTEPKQEAN